MKASVILPAYNAQSTLKEAIDSVLAQSFTDFELIIINDGSIDATDSIISSYQDKRIVYLKNEGNQGLIYTLNRGLEEAKGEYIIRMDADDICMPYRFEHQIQFMDNNPDIAASGTQIEMFGIDGLKQIPIPLSFEDLLFYSILTVPIYHPTAIIRREIVDKYCLRYNPGYTHAEDYKFWIDLLINGERIANIKEIGLKYRISINQITNKHQSEQRIISQKIKSEYIRYFFKLKNLDLPTKISYSFIMKYREILKRNSNHEEMQILLCYLYLSLNPSIYRIVKFIQSLDAFKIWKLDMKWCSRILLSPFTSKWDYFKIIL